MENNNCCVVHKEQSLPFNLNQVSLYELINSVELILYHVIPLPVVKNDHYIHIIPVYSYIAISKTHEYYV
ncbi:Uncharacterized protein FWK35_00025584 [Aphis craccivora]|uniref:Uncharacterized protein n=1 Tax=Aphis craccivora TaxID=307492 RepID=A0A6G0W0V7_APHCR|nr:Uncharacterized protein FWK35_00025584 [Aphis craccivora]